MSILASVNLSELTNNDGLLSAHTEIVLFFVFTIIFMIGIFYGRLLLF